MSPRRKIAAFTVEARTAKVYRDAEWNEYRVCFYLNGTKQLNADYHTPDKPDALATAQHWVNESTDGAQGDGQGQR